MLLIIIKKKMINKLEHNGDINEKVKSGGTQEAQTWHLVQFGWSMYSRFNMF